MRGFGIELEFVSNFNRTEIAEAIASKGIAAMAVI